MYKIITVTIYMYCEIKIYNLDKEQQSKHEGV